MNGKEKKAVRQELKILYQMRMTAANKFGEKNPVERDKELDRARAINAEIMVLS